MKNCSKRSCGAKTAAVLPEASGGTESTAVLPEVSGGTESTAMREGFPLPDSILFSEVFVRMELESLCSLACVCRFLRSMVSQALPTLKSLDLSMFSPNGELLHHIAPSLRGLRSVTIDCLLLDDFSIISILGPHIQELNLLKCASLSYYVLPSIGEKCPNLRMLVLELSGKSSPEIFKRNLIEMLKNLLYLEHLSIKIRGTESYEYDLASVELFLPKTLKFLKLQQVNEQGVVQFIEKLRDEMGTRKQIVDSSITLFGGFTLLHLSLVVDVISDRLMNSITSSFPHLVELNLEDRPFTEPKLLHDLTNNGLQFLGSLQKLTQLSIVRSRLNYPVSFKRINDVGILLLHESCEGLESVKLGGFSKVTDAGFSSLVHSRNLKKLEIRNAPLLSDLAFHIIGAASPLVELKLLSCNLITSAAIAEIASSSTLELLDTYGCRSIADSCLNYISCLSKLTSVNLGGADITDSGLSVLSKGDLPITKLSLRGCTRVTDRGIICLLNDGMRIKKTLSSLDIGHMPGISDRGIHAIISSADGLTELSMRRCFHVTNDSFRILASVRLQKLDLFECVGFSDGVIELLQEGHLFRGLRWVGVGGTYLVKRGDFGGRRPWLTVCYEGCEVGCHDGWQFHV
ncbi:hypothetical protein ACS0TY_016560 [Phlomoides rotata]